MQRETWGSLTRTKSGLSRFEMGTVTDHFCFTPPAFKRPKSRLNALNLSRPGITVALTMLCSPPRVLQTTSNRCRNLTKLGWALSRGICVRLTRESLRLSKSFGIWGWKIPSMSCPPWKTCLPLPPYPPSNRPQSTPCHHLGYFPQLKSTQLSVKKMTIPRRLYFTRCSR